MASRRSPVLSDDEASPALQSRSRLSLAPQYVLLVLFYENKARMRSLLDLARPCISMHRQIGDRILEIVPSSPKQQKNIRTHEKCVTENLLQISLVIMNSFLRYYGFKKCRVLISRGLEGRLESMHHRDF